MQIPKNSGFTLIEVVVVIAIAALILVAILIFVPQAQATQRDGDRKNAAAKTVSKLVECAANNRGALCGITGSTVSQATFNSTYMTGINGPGGVFSAAFQTAAPAAVGSSCSTSSTINAYLNAVTGAQFTQVCLEKGGWYQASQ